MFLMPGSRANSKKLPGSTSALNWDNPSQTLTINSNPGGTGVASSQPLVNLNQQWNKAGVAFTGIKANMTFTAGTGSSNVMDIQVNGSSVYTVNYAGTVTVQDLQGFNFFHSGTSYGAVYGSFPALIISHQQVQYSNASMWSANGTVASTLTGNIGPAGAHTTVQTWFTVLDNAGTTRYIPAF